MIRTFTCSTPGGIKARSTRLGVAVGGGGGVLNAWRHQGEVDYERVGVPVAAPIVLNAWRHQGEVDTTN